jgi:SGF29 tudor-like domain
MVSRHLVLPLPRSFSEAADWCHRYRKGSRVYAMYPHTTSLYTATVVDSTTYCRDDDDIVVVEFDGDDPDVTGAIPKCHIPARFVTMIPQEFPGAKIDTGSKSKSKKAGANSKATALPLLPDPPQAEGGLDDFLDTLDLKFEDDEGGFDGFDDLEFDTGLGD